MAITRAAAMPTAAGLHRWFGLIAIMLATVGFGLVLTVVVIGLPTISVKLGATRATWSGSWAPSRSPSPR
jgi:hypothetical protein